MVATFSDRRSKVVNSSNVGKLVKSSGRTRNTETISTSTADVTDSASPISRINGGSGRISTDNSKMTPTANPTSVPGVNGRNRAASWPNGPASAVVKAAMPQTASAAA